MVLGSGGELGVFVLLHQALELLDALRGDLDLDNPAASPGIVLGKLIDGTGLLLENSVDARDLAADGGVDIGGALDRFNGAYGIAGLNNLTNLGKLNKDDVAQRVSRVFRDSDHGGLAVA